MKLKKLQLLTVLLFILTILLMIIGLILIRISNFNYHNQQQIIKMNGFNFLNIYSINYTLCHCASHICLCHIFQNNQNYYNWIKLQIGIIFCVILVPILTIITLSLTFFIIGLKINLKNNNFWDAIQNCEIINNYYIH